MILCVVTHYMLSSTIYQMLITPLFVHLSWYVRTPVVLLASPECLANRGLQNISISTGCKNILQLTG